MSDEQTSEFDKLVSGGMNPRTARDLLAVLDAIEVQMFRLGFNTRRVRRLVAVASGLEPEDSDAAEDVLRSAVVLLHASLEDYLRSLSAACLRFAPASALNEVPLAGRGSDRPEKFFLGALVPFRDLTVLELIDRSVTEYLERTTYNNTREVAALLRNLGCDDATLKAHFSALDGMMARRHLVVHRADLNSNATSTFGVGAIDASVVTGWAEDVQAFAKAATNMMSLTRLEAIVPILPSGP